MLRARYRLALSKSSPKVHGRRGTPYISSMTSHVMTKQTWWSTCFAWLTTTLLLLGVRT